MDIEIKLVPYATGHTYHLRSAHIPPECEAGGIPNALTGDNGNTLHFCLGLRAGGFFWISVAC